MRRSRISRRGFLGAATGAAGFTIVPRHVLGGAGQRAPSDKLPLAGGGCGRSGVRPIAGVRASRVSHRGALRRRRRLCAKGVHRWPQAKRFRDFREMLATLDKDIDAVYCGTPDHSHAFITLAALRRKKHVCCFKPLTRTILECRTVVDVARRFDVPGGMREEYEQREYVEPVSVESRDLRDHLREQLALLDLTPRQQLLTEEFLGNLKEDGYLASTLEEVLDQVNRLLESHAAATSPPVPSGDPDDAEFEESDFEYEPAGQMMIGVPEEGVALIAEAMPLPPPTPPVAMPGVPYFTMAEVEEMLAILQRLDPPGICARDLRECLLLQLCGLIEITGDVEKLERLTTDT